MCPSGEGDKALCTLPSWSVDLDKPVTISVGVEVRISYGSLIKTREVGVTFCSFL